MSEIEYVPQQSGSHGRPSDEAPKTLSGHLGTLDIVFTVLAYNAPLTVVIGMIPLVMSMGNGLGAPVTFLVAGAMMLLFAVGFTTMSKHVPNAGAYYAYISAGLGKPLGLGSAFMAITAYFLMIVGVYLYVGVIYVSLFKSLFNAEPLPWWQWSLLVWAIVSVLGYLRIEFSAKVLTIALACEVILVCAWELAIVGTRGASHLTIDWLKPSVVTSGSAGLAILFAVTCFAGFEATAVFREEARDPARTVPRATYVAILVMAALFASGAYFFITATGPAKALALSQSDPSNSVLSSIGTFLGKTGLELVNVLMCSSIFACALAMHNILSRYIYSLGVDGTFPKACSAVHHRHGSPHRASLIVSVLSIAGLFYVVQQSIAPYDGYAALMGVSGYALLLLQVLTSASVISFFIGRSLAVSRIKTFWIPLVSLTGLTATAWLATINMALLTGSERAAEILLFIIFGSLVVGAIYALVLRSKRPAVYRAIGRQTI
ncbi:APC family permease [Burkholderia cepacia]|uniref:Amino acid permease n=1 Tax=Burkholderia cepacia GG4 TaxID=1009846 RepID=A0A9W3K7Q6_BURCE|nr:APC family permease [Burkholderia cepacia]AFQ51108.1 amino acid permease [Burkholderia cepacia GG4]